MPFDKDLDGLMAEAKKMQEKMQEAQKEIENMFVTGESGGGMVQIEMNGRHEVKRVKIKEVLMNDDVEILEDLVAAAINDAAQKIEKKQRSLITGLTGSMKLPPDFDLPG